MTEQHGQHGPARLIELREFAEPTGRLCVVESGSDIPFPIQRVFFVHAIPTTHTRGGHAHRELEQVIIASSGSFTVKVDTGDSLTTFELDRPSVGLYVPPMNWATLTNFSPASVVLVFASLPYDETDYYRDYDEFRRAVDTQK
jgi:WxcM-like, C-terminal